MRFHQQGGAQSLTLDNDALRMSQPLGLEVESKD